MKSFVQFLGAGAHDSGAFTLLLFFDEHRYLFNCSEGTQRAAVLQSIKVSRAEACFLSSLEWSRSGGLPGMLCTLRDMYEAGNPESGKEFKIAGPVGLQRLVEATQPFVRRSKFPSSNIELDDRGEDFFDGFLRVKHLVLDPRKSAAGRPEKKAKSSPKHNTFTTLAFLCIPPKILGKFNVKRAKELNLRPGPDYSRLLKGESVVLEDGATIHPSDCVGPSADHPQVIICDLPTVEHYNLFLRQAASEWSSHLSLVSDVFVISECRFLDFAPLPTTATIHRIHSNNQLVNKDFLDFQVALNHHVSPSYRLPMFEPPAAIRPFTKVHLHPDRAIEDLAGQPVHCHWSPPTVDASTRVSFLGTAAAIPGKYRNVSCIVLSKGGKSIVMDCGEGSLGQLRRLFGSAAGVVEQVSAICLSHIHADHHLGTFSLLLARPLHLPPLLVFAPEAFERWFREYEQCSGCSLNVDFVSCSGEQQVAVGGVQISSFAVSHCPDAYGFKLVVEDDGHAIAYSGDTRPSDNLVQQTHKSLLLIHEATMPNDLHEEAVDRKHCTVGEAIEVFRRSECEYCVLTHFTQRFAKSFPTDPDEECIDCNAIGYAADLLSFNLTDELLDVCRSSARLPSSKKEHPLV